MARKFFDQMTAWMVGIAGAGALYSVGYGIYKFGLHSATQEQNAKIARLLAEDAASNQEGPTSKAKDIDPKMMRNEQSGGEIPLKPSNPIAWSYSGSTGPSKWASLDRSFTVCGAGKSQSPVDISTTYTDSKSLPITFFYSPSRIKLENTGRTIKGTFTTLSNHISVDGERFDLTHFQLRSPAEHRLQDGTLVFELQMVHRTDSDKIAIISVLFNSGETNSALAEVFNKMPEERGSELADLLNFDPMAVLPKKKAFYTYRGSLTEPPCSEGVTWLVMQSQLELSPTQTGKFLEVIGKNSRPIQSINSRRIKLVPR